MKRWLVPLCLLLVVPGTVPWAAGGGEKPPLTWVWLPGDAQPESAAYRAAMEAIVTKATGRRVVERLTTDYTIAIESITSGSAAIALLGPYQYVLASAASSSIKPLVASSGPSGTLADAVYFGRLVVRAEDAPRYLKDGRYSLDGLAGRTISFVSPSSTAGFVIPAAAIAAAYAKTAAWAGLKPTDLMEGGPGRFFTRVLFGVTHQVSLANVLLGRADIAACNDIDTATYVDLASGEASAPGSVYAVRSDAPGPFDTLRGARFAVIWSVRIPNPTLAVNTDLLSAGEIARMLAAFTSDAVAADATIFVPPGSSAKSAFRKDGNDRFLAVSDALYKPIRDLLP